MGKDNNSNDSQSITYQGTAYHGPAQGESLDSDIEDSEQIKGTSFERLLEDIRASNLAPGDSIIIYDPKRAGEYGLMFDLKSKGEITCGIVEFDIKSLLEGKEYRIIKPKFH